MHVVASATESHAIGSGTKKKTFWIRSGILRARGCAVFLSSAVCISHRVAPCTHQHEKVLELILVHHIVVRACRVVFEAAAARKNSLGLYKT